MDVGVGVVGEVDVGDVDVGGCVVGDVDVGSEVSEVGVGVGVGVVGEVIFIVRGDNSISFIFGVNVRFL